MAEKIFDLLKLAYRQRFAIYRVGDILRSLTSGGFSLKRVSALFIAIIEMFSSVIFDGAMTPMGKELDLAGYNLVFSDEFDGDSLNTDVWEYRGSGSRRGGFNAESQVKVNNGNLVFTGEYLEDGEFGEGWYVGMIKLKKQYCKGYFEIRCKCNDGGDFWSAFWIQADHPYDHELSKGGVGGAEIDIFEAMGANEFLPSQRNSICSTVHCNGGDDDVENIDSCCIGDFKANNIYEEYNTYGLEWTDDEYIFYINGVETGRTSFSKGVSEVAEDVIVSLEIPEEIHHEKDFTTQYVVDYVKIWQK